MIRKSVRELVVDSFQKGISQAEISKSLGIPKQTVSYTIKRFLETDSNEDRPGRGRKRTATSEKNQRRVERKIERNPNYSLRQLSSELNIHHASIHRIVREDLKLKSFKMFKGQLLNDKQKLIRLTKCKALKQRFSHDRHRQILFSDEKLFSIEESHNTHNDRMWAAEPPDIESRIISHSQKPRRVMVWAGIRHGSKLPLVFIEEGVKINSDVYQTMLEEKVLPWAQENLEGEDWTFQQDSAPAHRSKQTQGWIEENFEDFIHPRDWPPYSPDLNPLDYSIWGILQANVGRQRHQSVDALKRKLGHEWKVLSQDVIDKAIDCFPLRLDMCIKAKGGHIEHR